MHYYEYDQNQDSKWPEDDTIQFPYRTPVPITIDTSKAREVVTPTPLQFNVHPNKFSFTKNSGKNLVSEVAKPILSNLMGGVLYNDTYKYFQCEFFWDNKLELDAGDTIDGRRTPLQAIISFWNTKYGTKAKAITKRDGIATLVIPINVIKWPLPNILFYPFQFKLKSIEKAESSTFVNEFLEYICFLMSSLTHDYYSYPGDYHDPDTAKIHYSAIEIVLDRHPRPFISYAQFKSTFGSLENKSGNLYSTYKPLALTSLIPTSSEDIKIAMMGTPDQT